MRRLALLFILLLLGCDQGGSSAVDEVDGAGAQESESSGIVEFFRVPNEDGERARKPADTIGGAERDTQDREDTSGAASEPGPQAPSLSPGCQTVCDDLAGDSAAASASRADSPSGGTPGRTAVRGRSQLLGPAPIASPRPGSPPRIALKRTTSARRAARRRWRSPATPATLRSVSSRRAPWRLRTAMGARSATHCLSACRAVRRRTANGRALRTRATWPKTSSS